MVMARQIRVLVVDDHTIFRQALRTDLEAFPNIQIVGEAQDGEEAVVSAVKLLPTVVVMDINMPKMNGIKATAVIKRYFPHIVIIGLSVNADRANREAMIQAGAAILLTKEAPVEELYQAIQLAVKSHSNPKSTTP